MSEEKLISIHLNSNKPQLFENFINSLAFNANNIKCIEVLVSIDKDDTKMLDVLKLLDKKFPNLIRIFETNLIKSFSDAWKPLNLLLKETSSSVKFISCMSDEVIFKTKNWDLIIIKYSDTYKDGIFRVRCSKYKNEIYKDIWECGYKPDSYAFYTKKWLDIAGQWNPCIGPDTFQECISYYLSKYGKNFQRNIIDNVLVFEGEEISTNLNFLQRIGRTRIYYKAFFILMSYKTQTLANQIAYKIVSEINDKNNNTNYIPINRRKIYLKNFSRRFNFFYYRGSPEHIIDTKIKNLMFMIWCYSEFLDIYVVSIINFFYKKNYLKKIIKNEKQIKQIEKIIKNEK